MIKRENIAEDGTRSCAIYSDCEKYRYILERIWDKNNGKIMFLALNPSTATEEKNDPTVARMVSFARSWGYGGVVVANVFAFRSTLPSDLKKDKNPVGSENDLLISKESKNCDKIVACWGNHGTFLNRSENVKRMIKNMGCLGITKSGEPKHPLYLRADSRLIKFN